MSTPGKVLTVLVTLFTIVAIALISLEAQLNANWGASLVSEQKKSKDAEVALEKQENETAKARKEVAGELYQSGLDIVVLDNNLIDIQRALSVSRETLSRLQYDIKRVEDTSASLSKSKEYRGQELEQTKQDLAKINQELDEHKKNNGDLRGTLASLADSFKSTLASNKELLKKLDELKAKSSKKPTTTASSR